MQALSVCASIEPRKEVQRWQSFFGECSSSAPGCYSNVSWSDTVQPVLTVRSHDSCAGKPVPTAIGDSVVIKVARPHVSQSKSPLLQASEAAQFQGFVANLQLSSATLAVHSSCSEVSKWSVLKKRLEARRSELEHLLLQSMLILDLDLQTSRLMMVLDLLSLPTVLVNEDAKVRFINSAAGKLLVKKQHVSLSFENQITLPVAAKNAQLRHFIKKLAHSNAEASPPMFLRYQTLNLDTLDYVRLSAVPLAAIANPTHPEPVSRTVKVEFFVAQTEPPVSTIAIQELFDATPSEAKLAQALCQGLAIDAYAIREGIAPSTVRWHLHNLLTRTETRSQAELIRLLLTVLRV
jgi:DNA-binding CsgD family transcriptional regulator